MGKGFNNYMCKKFFHPASRDNIKRVWIAEQQEEAKRKKEISLKEQYEREQELYENKSLISKESKEKLEMSFMYEPPPGTKKEEDRNEDSSQPFKFDWQRTWGNAPRGSWVAKDEMINEKPFGIAAKDSEVSYVPRDTEKLARDMTNEGMMLRWSAWDLKSDESKKKYEYIPETSGKDRKKEKKWDPEKLLKEMTKKEKRKLLKRIEKIERKNKKSKKSKKNKYKKE